MNETLQYLDLEDLVSLTADLSAGPIRDIGLLDSASARPRSSAFGEDAYPSVALKAAALLQSLVKNHALVDGNERLAWLATTVFLDVNGYTTSIEDEAAFALVMAAAQGLVELPAIADALGVVVQPPP